MSTNYQPVDDYTSHGHHSQDEERYGTRHINDDVPLRKLAHANDNFHVIESSPTSDRNGKQDNVNSRRRVRRGHVSRLWAWQLSAAVFSFICMAVIVIVLSYEDGKRLSGWALMISPNAVISFITTLAKSSCLLVLAEVIGQLRWMHFASAPRVLRDLQLFDAASRGPWGALRLMLRMKTAALLASCASLLTIAALVVDPFAQLVITFPTRPTSTPLQVASINVAKAYDANTSITANHGPPYPVAQNAPFQLQSAVISAAFGVSPKFDITCPTSNCTFPPVSTLGICSTCENVVDVTNTSCSLERGFITACNTTVPRQLLPPMIFNWTVFNDAVGVYADVWNSSSLAATPAIAAYALDYGETAVLAAFTALKLDRSLFDAADRPTKPSEVNQCILAYCLKTYDGIEVRNGETIIGSASEELMSYSSYNWFLDPPETGYSALFTMQASSDGQMTGPNYTMNYWDHLNLGQYMRDVLNSTVGRNTGTYVPGDGGSMAPSFGLAMYNADNLTVMVNDIAESMTNSMRTSQNNITTVNGTALVIETYLHIEWKWLSLPIAVTVLSFVLLITVMIVSKRQGVEAWKSSSLPLLFYGLEGWDGEVAHGFEDAGDLKNKSENMKGFLSLDSGHRVFVRDGLVPVRRDDFDELQDVDH